MATLDKITHYQINTAITVAQHRLENGADQSEVFSWLLSEVDAISKGETVYDLDSDMLAELPYSHADNLAKNVASHNVRDGVVLIPVKDESVSLGTFPADNKLTFCMQIRDADHITKAWSEIPFTTLYAKDRRHANDLAYEASRINGYCTVRLTFPSQEMIDEGGLTIGYLVRLSGDYFQAINNKTYSGSDKVNEGKLYENYEAGVHQK